jgi:hypothetical protein
VSQEPASPESIPVVYVVSGTRSGSTLMDTILGSIEGWFSAGELRFLWERGILEGRRCGCGEPVVACPVWSSVLADDHDGLGAIGDVNARDVVDWQHQTLRVRHTLRTLRTDPARLESDDPLKRYADVLTRVYAAVRRQTGASVIVDSSKHPSDAALLRHMPGIDAYWIHIVRDPRAVVFSWKRRKPDPDGQDEMPRWSIAHTALNWDLVNGATDLLARTVGPARLLRVRYEDFMRSPRRTVGTVISMLGRGADSPPFSDERTAEIAPNHTVSGNPNRFRSGATELRIDDEWVRAQPRSDRLATTALTAPMLLRYRYPLKPHAES